MSTPLRVLLNADPRVEGNVADDKADPLLCLQLQQIYVGRALWTTNMSLNSLFSSSFSCDSCCTVLENREGWPVAGDLVPQETTDSS